jgi:hypothetical protein
MMRIATSVEAFEAIARTLLLGSVRYENKTKRGKGSYGSTTLSLLPEGHARAGGELERRDPSAGGRDDASEADEGEVRMAYPQSTLEEIVATERSMFLDGEARYGRHFKHARAATMYLSLCVASVEQDRSDTFGRLLSLTRKHHTLAFLSALRLNKVQAMTNLRQVLEAGAGAAYAIANPDVRSFAEIDAFGIMDPSKKLSKHYKWLNDNCPDKSKWIEGRKGPDQQSNRSREYR